MGNEIDIYMILIAKLISIRCDQINVPKGSSYIKSPNSLRNENATTNQKTLVKDICSMLLNLYSPKMKHWNKILAGQESNIIKLPLTNVIMLYLKKINRKVALIVSYVDKLLR